MSQTIVHFEKPISADAYAPSLHVPFTVSFENPGLTNTVNTTFGQLAVMETSNRVWIEVSIGGTPLLSYKLDPNDENDSYGSVLFEISQVEPFDMPVTTDDRHAIAAVVAAYLTNGRPSWS